MMDLLLGTMAISSTARPLSLSIAFIYNVRHAEQNLLSIIRSAASGKIVLLFTFFHVTEMTHVIVQREG